jgi:hypothetical protein
MREAENKRRKEEEEEKKKEEMSVNKGATPLNI